MEGTEGWWDRRHASNFPTGNTQAKTLPISQATHGFCV